MGFVPGIGADLESETKNAAGVFMKPVIAEFILYKKDNDEATGNAYGKACNINGSIQLIPQDIPECNDQVFFPHT